MIPIGSWLLRLDVNKFFICVNAIALIYGVLALTMCFSGGNTVFYLQSFVAFPLVSISRQLVYSGIFYQVSTFGFEHFGKLLGTVNTAVAISSCVQFPLVEWAHGAHSYKWPAVVLLLLLLPILRLKVAAGPSLDGSAIQTIDCDAENNTRQCGTIQRNET